VNRIRKYPSGVIRADEHLDDEGLYHRTGGKPAVTLYDKHGRITFRIWYLHGKIHRDGNHPAWISYDNHGEPLLAKYYKYGVELG
jgi:hypothetical protein